MSFINHKLHMLSCRKLISLKNTRLPFHRTDVITNLGGGELSGLSVGIPINIIDNIFTNLHYGYDITNIKTVVLQFLIAYYTYGKDRYKDSVEYFSNSYTEDNLDTIITNYNISDEKFNLYSNLYNYKNEYLLSFCGTFYLIVFLLLNDPYYLNNIPFTILLYSSEYYKQLKKNIQGIKPFYVSFMWTVSAVILPCLLYDHDYSILGYPQDYMPCFLTLFASTNMADIPDMEEDKINNIKTLPVILGKKNVIYIVFLSLSLSSYIFGTNEHYFDRPLINLLFELQNIGLSIFALQNII